MEFDVLEELWFGNVKDDDLRRAAAASLAAQTARLRGICPFPVAAKRLLELTSSPDYRVWEVSAIIESDPALTSRLLRIVNSALAGLKRPCRSVPSAVTLLGQRNLRQSALSASALAGFDTGDARGKAVLEHSNVVAALCGELAPLVHLPAEEMYLCGLLHDIGKLMLLQAGDGTYPALLDEGLDGDALRTRECAVYGFDHGVLGGQVLSDWRVPEPIPLVVGWHHDLARAAEKERDLRAKIHLVHFANELPSLLGQEVDAAFFEQLAERHDAVVLGLSAASLEGVWERLRYIADGHARGLEHRDAPEVLISEAPAANISIRPAVSLRPSLRSSLRPSLRPSFGPMRLAEPKAVVIIGGAPADDACGLCGEETFGLTCPRCGIALCTKHEPAPGSWCSQCEQKFRDERQGWADRTHAVAGIVSFVVAAGVLALVLPWQLIGDAVEPLSILVLVGFLGFVAVFAWTRWTRRASFARR